MKLLDLFCCQGGASMGYRQAGFEVVGVDLEPQPHYPFEFIQADVLQLDEDFIAQFDAIAASPPCKVHTSMKAFSSDHWTDLIPQTRAMLIRSGKPYVIENVVGAPLINPVQLCGSMFGLYVRRHRLFESNWTITVPECDHEWHERTSPGFLKKDYHGGVPRTYRSSIVSVFGRGEGLGPNEKAIWSREMGIDWMTKDGLRESIPPAYTKYIGDQLMKELSATRP